MKCPRLIKRIVKRVRIANRERLLTRPKTQRYWKRQIKSNSNNQLMIIKRRIMILLRKMKRLSRMTSQATVMENNLIPSQNLQKKAKKNKIRIRRYHITLTCLQKLWVITQQMACLIFLFKPSIKLVRLVNFKCHSISFLFLTHTITQLWHSINSTTNSAKCHQ
jgi:hypothetical protein